MANCALPERESIQTSASHRSQVLRSADSETAHVSKCVIRLHAKMLRFESSVRNNHGIPIRDPPTPREIPPRLPPEPKPSPPLESRSVTPRQLTTHPRSKMKVSPEGALNIGGI